LRFGHEGKMEVNSSLIATVGGGFFSGVLVGYALKKVIKLVSIVVGLFLAGLAYLQYQQIASMNWTKLQIVSEGAVTTLTNAATQIPTATIDGSTGQTITAEYIAFSLTL
jgi:uncharacterized membrane protein (Fun14 family)